MCGIIGQTKGNPESIKKALHTFSYRGPDAEAIHSDANVALGHLRLSIIDPDMRSNQPFFDEQGELGIVFNGEIYNYKEVRDELIRVHNVQFRTNSDTEVLLYGYKVWAEALLPRLRGMFAFAIYDTKQKAIFLARDHAGIKPLYYSLSGEKLFFASELKGVVSLLRSCSLEPTISQDAIGLYLSLGYIPSPLTLCEQVLKLPRGSWLRFDIGSEKAEVDDWKPDTAKTISSTEPETLVRDAVIEHTISDVPVGVFFSGGIDSSVIALALRDAGINLATYSVKVEGRDADEPYFRSIAEHLGIKAHTFDFGAKEFEEVFEHVLSRMDDPIADPSIFPTAFVSRRASSDVKVVLSGEGGDELFCGYPRALAIARMHAKSERVGVLDTLTYSLPRFRGKRAAIAHMAQLLRKPVAYYMTQASLAFDRTPKDAWYETHAKLAEGDPVWFDRDWYLENMLLRKTDMATMYSSIEGRVPLLDVRLWNRAPKLFSENARGNGKQILRNMLLKTLPSELVNRPKSGFGIPLSRLYANSELFREAAVEARRSLSVGDVPLVPTDFSIEDNVPLSYGLIALHRSLANLGLSL